MLTIPLLSLLLAAPGPEATPIAARSREMMTTRVTVALADVPEPLAERAFDAAFAVFERVEDAMNEWRPGSPLALFDESHRGRVPSRDAVAGRCALVAYRRVEIAPRGDGCAVRLPRARMRLGLGGLAKGWGVDRAVERLRALGLKSFFVQAGGDLYAAGRRGDRPWRVGIRDPRGGPDDTLGLAEVEDAAFSTSGDYERWFEVEGVRYHHIVDPRTCEPARASRQSTVLARTASDAEILTKATFILGGDAGLELAERNGAGAIIVDAAGGIAVSRSLAGRVAWTERGAEAARAARR